VSCSLQRSVAQAILNRIDGNHSALAVLDLSVSPPLVEGPLEVLAAEAPCLVHPLGTEPAKVAVPPETPVAWMTVPRPGCHLGSGDLFCQCGDTLCSGTDRVRVSASRSSSSSDASAGEPPVEPPVTPTVERASSRKPRTSPRVPPPIPPFVKSPARGTDKV
jgi:hypothetical protein